MVQMDFLAANYVCIVRLCSHAHHAVIFVITQLSCYKFKLFKSEDGREGRFVCKILWRSLNPWQFFDFFKMAVICHLGLVRHIFRLPTKSTWSSISLCKI